MKLSTFSTLLYVGFTAAACAKVKFVPGGEDKTDKNCRLGNDPNPALRQVTCGAAANPLKANVAIGNTGQFGRVQITNGGTIDRAVVFGLVDGQGTRGIEPFLVKAGETCQGTIGSQWRKLENGATTTNRALLQNLGGPVG